MGFKIHTPAAALLAVGAILVAGCGSSSTTAGVSSTGPGSSTSSGSPTSTGTSTASAAPSSSSSSPAAAAGAARFTKGQKLGSNQLEQRIKAAITKAGGTYASTTKSSKVTSTGHVRLVGNRTEGTFEERVGGKKISVIVLGGNAYVKGFGIGSKPWIKVTPTSTGPLAQGLKPLLTITQGAPLSDSVQWTVTATSASGSTVTSSPANGTTVTDRFDSKGLPISTVVRSAAGTKTDTYSDYGKPVTVTAPPASQVADVAAGQKA